MITVESSGLRGDVNDDGETNIADINAVIEAILNSGNDYNETFDVNGDGVINIADINAIINEVLKGGCLLATSNGLKR